MEGGGAQKSPTLGVFAEGAHTVIRNTKFEKLMYGGVVADLDPASVFIFVENVIVECQTCGVYIEGYDSKPFLAKNIFMLSPCEGLIISQDV